jgi:hypothetical protein
MTSIHTKHGDFNLAEAAYGAGVKLGSASTSNEMEKTTREGVYLYFTDHPDELTALVDNGFLTVSDISAPTANAS